MAIIKCSECGGQISNKASMCPHCGNPIDSSPAVREVVVKSQVVNPKVEGFFLQSMNIGCMFICGIILFLGVLIFLLAVFA